MVAIPNYIVVRNVKDVKVERALKRVRGREDVTPFDIKAAVARTTGSLALVDRLFFEPQQLTREQAEAVLKDSVAYPIENNRVRMDKPLYGPE